MTNIYLIRHGEAEGNVFRRFHGQYDSLLMPRGYAQRECVAKRFQNIQVDACFSSDLIRTRLTAESIYIPKGLSLNVEPAFREVGGGIWEDLPFGYLDQAYPEQMQLFNTESSKWSIDGGESYRVYTDRFITAMESVARAYRGGTVCIFSHAAVIRGVLMHLFFDDSGEKVSFGDNTAVSHLQYENGKFSYEYINDNSHIPLELSTYYRQAWWRETGNRKEANLFYEPFSAEDLEHGLTLPQQQAGDILLTGRNAARPVGIIAMGKPQGTTGVISGITLSPDMEGRFYADQLLGCAFSHFRSLGCRELMAEPGDYPEDVLSRYAFADWKRSIDNRM